MTSPTSTIGLLEPKSPNILHSKKTPKWGSPAYIADLARAIMGSIDTDPASSPEFNANIGALRIYTENQSGLDPIAQWLGCIFLNPPGGLVSDFWARLIREILSGSATQAIWIGFSIEQLCILQDASDSGLYPLDFSTVIIRKRLNFVRDPLTPALPGQKDNPSHGNYITGINIPRDAFDLAFGGMGRVVHGPAAMSAAE